MESLCTEGTSADCCVLDIFKVAQYRMQRIMHCDGWAMYPRVNQFCMMNEFVMLCCTAYRQHKANSVLTIAVVSPLYSTFCGCKLISLPALRSAEIPWVFWAFSPSSANPPSHSLGRKPTAGKESMMALALSTWAKKRLSPTSFFFFFFFCVITWGSVMLSIPQLGREVFLLPLLLCHVSVWH